MAKSKSFIPEDAVKTYNELNAALEKNNNVLDEHFNALVKISGELSKVSVSHKQLTTIIDKYNSVNSQVTKVYDENKRLLGEMTRLEQRLLNAESEMHKSNMQKKVDYQAISREQRLQMTVMSAYTTELEKLYAKQELANRAAQKYLTTLGAESSEYRNAVAEAKKYGQEINQMEINTGKLTGKTTSMYGATFQLTQVMRELPNFAINARIGFMSLSNNLPMLADSFSILSKQIDETTGKAYGARGALKIFAKSLLSINTVLIVASTLLIQYGDKLAEAFTRKVSAAEQAHRDFIKSLKEGNNGISTTFKEITRLSAILKNVDGVYITSKESIDEFNKTFGDTLGMIDSTAQGLDILTKKQKAYLEVTMMQSYIDVFGENLSKQYTQIRNLEKEIEQGPGFWDKYWNQNASLGISGYEGWMTMKSNELNRLNEELKNGINDLFKEYEEMYKFANNNGIDLLGGNNGGQSRELRDIFIKLDIYNQARAKIERDMKDNELDMSKEATNGVLNDFKTREKAISEYYKNSIALADMDYEIAVDEAYQKMQKDLERINSARKANEKIKASDEEKAKRSKELDEEEAKVKTNYETAKTKANDKANKEILDAEIKLKNNIKELWSDKIDIELYNIDIKEDDMKSQISEAYSKAKNEAEKMSGFEIFASALGGEVDNSFLIAQLEHNKNLAKIKAELLSIEEKRAAIEKGLQGINSSELEAKAKAGTLTDEEAIELENFKSLTEQKLDLEREASEKRKEIKKEESDFLIEQENDLQKKMQELQVELAKETYDLINQLVAQSFERRLKEVEDWAETENERVDAQVKSEVISEEQAEAQRQSIENQREQREKEIKRKRAIAEKAQGAFEIGIQTAIAIMKASASVPPPLNVPLIATMAALGAVQLAAVLAKPIPEYATGTEDHKGGLAVVGDGGRHELIQLPDGTMFKSPKVPTIMDLPKHTAVEPNYDRAIMEMSAYGQIDKQQPIIMQENKEQMELMKESNKILRIIAKKNVVIVNKSSGNFNSIR